MATIVQPYSPWREQLAANFFGPILSNVISNAFKNSQEANRNRKMNAIYGDVVSGLGTQTTDPLLESNPMPDGYNDNGWARSFHNTFTPITQYDMGTAGITPLSTTQQNTPTALDIMKAISSRITTPRYNMLNNADVMKMFEPVINAAGQARTEEQKQAITNAYRNAPDPNERFDILLGGNINGHVDNNTVNAYEKNYEFNNPNLPSFSLNTGNETILGSYNPRTGAYTEGARVPMSMTPGERERLNWDMYKYNNPYYTTTAVNSGDRTDILNVNPSTGETKIQGSIPKANYVVEKGADGTAYRINVNAGGVEEVTLPNGEIIKLNVPAKLVVDEDGKYRLTYSDGTPMNITDPTTGNAIRKPQKKDTLTYTDKTDYRTITSRINSLRKEEAKIDENIRKKESELDNYKNVGISEELSIVKDLRDEIEQLKARKASIPQEIKELEPQLAAIKAKEQSGNNQPITPMSSGNIDMLAPVPQELRPNGEQTTSTSTATQQTAPTTPTVQNVVDPLFGNVVTDDVRPQVNNILPKPQLRTGIIQVNLPDKMKFNEARDKDSNKIVTLEEFKKLLGVWLGSPKFIQYKPEEIIEMAYNEGYRIKN